VTLYTRRYASDQEVILQVKPGITDLSSIEFIDLDDRVGAECPDAYFHKNILPVKNELRVQYAQKMTFWGDIKIIIRTAVRLLIKIINR
jgi:lipopolysaccharide/colanic/teichoic acid biosynthesis glycosyltransferase